MAFRLAVALVCVLFVALTFGQEEARCAYCIDKDCGPDGVGGSCGTCGFGEKCYRGSCICDRGCTGFECGPDNCGTSCGDCLPGQTCVNGLCTGACTPQCVRDDGSFRTCGWDRCGGCCGDCPEGFRCRDGTCECYPVCAERHCGPDGCGGSCGTCEGNAVCQDDNDPFPGQCYIPCDVGIIVEVRQEITDTRIADACPVDISGPLGFSTSVTYPGTPVGEVEVDVTDGQLGEYTFTTTCAGYQVDFETHQVTEDGQRIIIYLVLNTILIEVRDEETDALLPSASIEISATGYSLSVNWVSPSFVWNHGGFLSYTFTTSASGYTTRTVTEVVTAETTLITLYLGFAPISLTVVECPSREPVATATITVSDTVINYNGASSFTPPNGFGTYTFTTESPNYVSNVETVTVTETTTLITLCVNLQPVEVIITQCTEGGFLPGAEVEVVNDFYDFDVSLTYTVGATFFTPVGYSSSYTFDVELEGFFPKTEVRTLTPSTTTVEICLEPEPFCGDGVCSGDETASPTSANRCHDCGRLRGVISLAVGQKDQLVNISVSVWAHPTNPATFLRSGTTLPNPDFEVVSDSKGFFGISQMSFDSPAGQRDPGQYSRRFYFRLAGQFTDRTGDDDVIVTLLPLWWNYELVNTQWLGSGDLTATNNSPSLYFYMTPPFPQEDALVRIILSWGTLISNPSNSLPDMDLVVAGPVDDNAIATYGSGIINFRNKDAHAEADELPFAKLITDSAQGFGPEVFDFYGRDFTNIGFSESYAPGAEANAYELWVDRPNSSPNQDSAFTFLYDTNSFIVVYVNNGVVNEQVLFEELTGVEHAYGFYNNDQWNDVPQDATLWHIIDIIEGPTTIKFDGFPGENDPQDRSEAAGAKYAFNAGFFEATKSIPCGHTSARGANPAYCPATLEYPQNNKK